jgi:SPP1 gp7 family putative phage head morphogenesis protein
MLSHNQLEQIRRRKKFSPTKKLKKPPKWIFPHSAERQYRKQLYELTFQLRKLIDEILVPQLPSLIQEVNILTPDGINTDGFIDKLLGLILTIEEAIQPKVEETIREAEKIGLQIAEFNQAQFEKITNSVFGLDLFVDQPWLQDQLKLFASQNSMLIKSIPIQELEQVAGMVERGLQEGSRFETFEDDLIKRFGITRRRAKLIARDQTTKLNASLTKLRQQELGVEEYIWQTAGDERVRATHRANDGKKFRWDNPPKETGNPGTDVNCRCVAIPVLEGVLEG